MKKNFEYLSALRKVMAEEGIDLAIITSTDPHQSEIPPHHWRGREWLTGFASDNGTSGTAVVTPDEAYCWTDNRYFLQAELQLKDTGFAMMPEDGPEAVDMYDWITEHTQSGQTVGIDGTTFSISQAQRLEQELNDNGVKLRTDFYPFDAIYPERPSRPDNKLFVHDESIVGENVDSKMNRIMEAVKSDLANAILISSLDDIAWATNLRTTGDINYSPMFVGYLYIDEGKRVLFVDSCKLTPEVEEHLKKYNIETRSYESVFDFVSTLPKSTRLLIDPGKTSRALYDKMDCTPVFGGNAVAKLKGIKSETMLKNFRIAMEKDGVALTRFFMEVEEEYPKGQLTEMSLSKRLTELRLQDPSCVDNSFCPILGWNENAALAHYEPTEEENAAVVGDGLLLVDSGGQYIYGTTDITRTVALGTPTTDQIHNFTLVLKGHVDLSMAVFPAGTRGAQLDALARMPLWKEGKAYFHGTGHGVGFFINCHEGPQSIRTQENPVALEPGMVTSNEPAIYFGGRYGIRTENLIAVVPAEKTEFGQFLKFDTLTLFPYDSRLIDLSMLNQDEIDWINAYHTEVRSRLTPLLSEKEAAWIVEKTKPLKKA